VFCSPFFDQQRPPGLEAAGAAFFRGCVIRPDLGGVSIAATAKSQCRGSADPALKWRVRNNDGTRRLHLSAIVGISHSAENALWCRPGFGTDEDK
jgi:hypothetical protein